MRTADLTHHDAPSSGPGVAPPDARGAVLASFRRPGRSYWLLLGFLAVVVAIGIVAWVIQLRRGLNVAGYNDHAFWAIYIADVVTFVGVSYGGAVISAILRLTGADWRAPLSRLAEGTAVVTVLIGGAFIIPHLGRPDRIWELLTRPNLSSPIFWDFVAVSTYTLGSIVFFVLPLFPDMAILHNNYGGRLGRRARPYGAISRGWIGSPRQRSVLHGALGLVAIMIIPLAVSVHSVLSWAFVLVSRPWWHESIWAPYFVVAALYSGVALVILVVAAFRRAYHLEAFITPRHFARLGFIMATFAAAYLYLTFADILPDAYVGEKGPAVVFTELLTGHFAPYFWLFIFAAGVLPLLLVALRRTRTIAGMVTAAAVVVPTMWLKRMLMVVDPSTYDRVTHTFGQYHFTWISVAITLAGVAAIPLLLMLLFRAVPLLSIDEIEELAGQPEAIAANSTSNGHAATPSFVAGDSVGAASEPPAAEGHHSKATASRQRGARRWPFGAAGTAVLLALAATVGVGLSKPAHADAPATAPAPTAITLHGSQTQEGVELIATLLNGDQAPAQNTTVEFFEYTTEFGPKGQLVPLGQATTGASGTARLTYQPPLTGVQRFVAEYAGARKGSRLSATTDVTVTTAHAVYQPAAPKPFATLGKGLVGVLLTGVTLILLTLLTQIARVRRACKTGA